MTKEREELERIMDKKDLSFYPQEVIVFALKQLQNNEDRCKYLSDIYYDFATIINKHNIYYFKISKARHNPDTNFEEMCDAR